VKKQHVTLHGEDIAYYKEGHGPVVLLIHGMAGSAETWKAVIPTLAQKYTVIAPDLLGHGDSARARADYSPGGFATGLRDLLLRLGFERATIVGQSLGGGVAMYFAYQFPQQCERLVLVGSGGFGREVNDIMRVLAAPGGGLLLRIGCRSSAARLARKIVPLLNRRGILTDPALREIGRSYESLTDEATRRVFLHTLRSVIDTEGQRLNALNRLYLTAELPRLIVWGDKDPIIPIEHALTAHDHMKDARLEIFPGVGHYPHCEAPERFLSVLTDFIESTEPAELTFGRRRQLMLAVG
jgi:pimeloyl-ACP methyl ester carboxylesterase